MKGAVGLTARAQRVAKGSLMSSSYATSFAVPRAAVVLKAPTIAALVGVAYIHYLDITEKLNETAYVGLGYIGLVAGCILTVALLLRRDARTGFIAAAGLCTASFVCYVVSRTTGLPFATYHIGNWSELSGTVALVLEAGVVLLAAQALRP
jgi:hypothetical protein